MAGSTLPPSRWLSVLFLALATAMVVLGLTVFSNTLAPATFLVYWLVCFCFTGLAAWAALMDMRAIRRQTQEAQRDLIEETMKEIAEEKRRKGEG